MKIAGIREIRARGAELLGKLKHSDASVIACPRSFKMIDSSRSMPAREDMQNPSVPESQKPNPVLDKSDWVLTQNSFRQFLAWLDEGNDSEGQRYLEIRRRLVLYFDRKNCFLPEELADETLNRVARRLEEEGSITGDAPARYCYIVARFVFLESLRRHQKHALLNDTLAAPPDFNEERIKMEKRAEALEKCMQNLDAGERYLIIAYYQDKQRTKIENRRKLAAELRLTANALSIRACRIRGKLETCLRKSLVTKI